MKIAITAAGPNLDAAVDPRFGRAPYFLIVDPETMACEAMANENADAGGGAGIQTAKWIADLGAGAVLTGNCGPNAHRTLTAAGVQVYCGVEGVARAAVERFKKGEFQAAAAPNVNSHHGQK